MANLHTTHASTPCEEDKSFCTPPAKELAMPEPFPIIDRAIYDDKTLNEQAGIDYGTLKKARKAGDIRYATLGKRHVYLGFWIFDWLSRISVAEASCQMEVFCPIQKDCPIQGDVRVETEGIAAREQGDWGVGTDKEGAQLQGEPKHETDTWSVAEPPPEAELTCEPDYDQGGFDARRRDW